MPRIAVTETSVPASYSGAGVLITYTAADLSSKNSVALSGDEIVLATNTGVADHTVTINSAPDPKGRLKDITTETLHAGDTHVYQRFPQRGYRQTDGTLHLEASHASVKFAVLKLQK